MIRIRGCRPPRPLLYALLALAVPLPAFALSGGDQGPQSLSVSASLGGCGLAQTTIMCEIDASWSAIDGADYYTASVTAPDGSVTDFGNVSSGSASVYVPYAGDGSYSVQVTAWGEPDAPDQKAKVVARENSASAPAGSLSAGQGDPGEKDPGRDSASPEQASSSPAASAGDDPGSGSTQPTDPGDSSTTDDPPVETTPTQPTPPPPDCTTPDPPTTPDTTTSSTATPNPGASSDPTKQAPPPAPDPVDPACR